MCLRLPTVQGHSEIQYSYFIERNISGRKKPNSFIISSLPRCFWEFGGTPIHLMVSGTLERCSLHPIFSVHGRWGIAGYAYVDIENYVGGGIILWEGNVLDNEHRCIFYYTLLRRNTMGRSWGSLLCPSSMPIASHCTTLSGSVHNSLKHPSISAILTTHPPFSMFGSGSVEMTGVEQHSKGQNQQPDQLYVKKMGCAAWCKWAWFSDNLATHYYSKTAHRKVAFYCGQPKHTYPVIRLSNQHLDMPYLWNGWIISAKGNVPDTVQAHLCIIFERKTNRKKV